MKTLFNRLSKETKEALKEAKTNKEVCMAITDLKNNYDVFDLKLSTCHKVVLFSGLLPDEHFMVNLRSQFKNI